MTKTKRSLGTILLRSIEQAVAIERGRLKPSRRLVRSVAETTVTPPPRYRSTRIRRLRENLGLSQPVFAKALNVSVGTVRAWEQGARIPDGPSRRLLELAERHPKVILSAIGPST